MEIDLAYEARAENDAAEADLVGFLAFMEERGITLPFEQVEQPKYFQTAQPLRRPSHMAGRMTRKGSSRHTVRPDRGTKRYYAEIKAENAGRQSWKKDSHRSWRKYNRVAAECRNPRIVNRVYRELIGK